ncbi:MAG: pyridoxal-phosphate-dependent aminotransferase family protein [Halobacteriota archaeon]
MDLEDTLLMMPGPVPVAPKVLRAMSKPMINHRGKEFSAMFDDCTTMLKEIFQTQNDLFILSGSGTASMEAALGCTIDKEDKVVAIENGKFGERFKDIAARYGQVVPLEFEWGQSVDLDLVEEKLSEGAKAVTMVHNETSAGIRNPAPEVGKLAKKYDALFIMDGVTSIGGDYVKVDDWGVDIAVVGSQKCVAAPPGLSMLSVSERAFDAMNKENLPYYLDLKAYRKSAEKSQTPYTPAVPLFFGLQEALKIVMEEGMKSRIRRQATGAAAIRAAMDVMGVEMFPQLNEVSDYSNTVSAMKAPEGVSGNDIKSAMIEKGIIIAGGQNRLSGQIFRIGSMGNFAPKDIMLTIQELELVLKKLGVVNEIGAGTEAAASELDTL